MLYHEPHWTAKEPWKTSKLPSGGHSSFLNSTVALCNIYYLKSNKVCETRKAWNLLCYSSQAKFLSVLFLLAKMYFSKNLIMRGVLHSTQKKQKHFVLVCFLQDLRSDHSINTMQETVSLQEMLEVTPKFHLPYFLTDKFPREVKTWVIASLP